MKVNRNKNLHFILFIFVLFVSSPGTLTAGRQIPDCLLSYQFGPEQHIVIVEKSTQSLFIYSNYQAEPLETFKVTSGKNHGPKLEEGDMKTPEGIYFFKRILSGAELPKTDDYGDKAFTLNYPNPIDKKENKEGSGIWLHGAFEEEKINFPNNSRGCVVMKNPDLIKVSKYIFLDQTPICIYNKIKYETIENIRKKRERLINYLKEWKEHWENKNIDRYTGYYEKDFFYSGMNLDQFKAYKRRLNKLYRFIKVILSDINIYAFKNYFVVTFKQLYISDKNHFYNKKIQYWMDYEDKGRIADESGFQLPPPTKFEISKGNYITIDEFRKDYLKQIKTETIAVSPHEIHLRNISIFGQTVKLFLTRSGSARNLKVIPVLRMENRDSTRFQSLPGIPLNGGVPRDYSRGILLEKRETTVVMTKEKDFGLKSLTLFLVNSQDKHEQIITYFFNH
ncbi:MAG: L,D-transpeptidase family protein [Candidatus Aminicenantes bacterium]|nr:MAG: L,D-transpeptidase family protein [Candidatus Aminicenantes bacterium]